MGCERIELSKPPACKAGALPTELTARIKFGGPYQNRTDITSVQAMSSPIKLTAQNWKNMEPLIRFERMTLSLQMICSTN